MRQFCKRNLGGVRWWAILSLAAMWSVWSPKAQATGNPAPFIESISPAAVQTATGQFTLTVSGANFVSGSVVQWNGTALLTALVSGQLQATVPAADIAADGTALVTVSNGSGVPASNVLYLPVTHSTTSLNFRETEKSPSAGVHPYLPVVSDFNQDGNLDIAVSNESKTGNQVSVFLGTGGGSFKGASNFTVGELPEGLAEGDFNGDGHQDLAVANFYDATVTILLGSIQDGAWSFQQPGITTSLTSGTQPYLVATGDFNGDGKLDVAVACLGTTGSAAGFVTILLGNGDGTFASNPANYGTIGQPAGLSVADFNGDGILDLAVSDAGSTPGIWILTGDGLGGFSVPETPLATQGVPAGIVAADFNGDGQPDLAVAYSAASQISVLINNNAQSPGTFLPPHKPYDTGGPGDFLAAADLNGDGILDVAVPNAGAGSNSVSVLLGNGDGTFAGYTSFTVDLNFNSVVGVVAADFNNDGRIDLAFTGGPNGDVAVLIQAPEMTPSPSSLSFGNQTKGTQSAAQTVTLTNSGGAPLTIYGIHISGSDPTDFALAASTNPCGTVLESGATCTVNVTFSPSTSGSLSGSLSISSNAPAASNPQLVSLSGTGLAPLAGVSIPSLTFGNQLVGTTSTSQAVTLSNTGNGTLTINSVTVSSGFTQSNNCGSSVSANSTCTITVSFAPSGSGTITGTVTVGDNSGETTGSTQTISLTGSAIAPAGLAPASLSFASQMVGTTSVTQTLTVSNTNSTALSITSVAITGSNASDFLETNTCGSSVAASANCTISVSFKPSATGTRTATVTVTDNASGAASSTQSTTLTGTGVAPVAGVAPSGLTFASQTLGTTSATQALTLSNTGSTALSIASVTITGTNSGDFAETNTCGSSVAASTSCTISVSFTPAANGARSATLTVSDNSNGVSSSTQTANLSGTGVSPQVSLAPSSVTFAGQLVGTTSAVQAVTLSNVGTGALTLGSVTSNGDFAQTNTCGTSAAAGASCTIKVTFAPSSAGTHTGTLTLTDNNNATAGSTQTVNLTGTGTAPGVALSATTLTFTGENVGTASPGQAITVTNTGTAALTLTSITAGGDFSESNTCGASLIAGASCSVTVTFKPTAILSRTGTLTVTDNASSGTQMVSLNGTGLGAEPNISPSTLAFSAELVGATGAAQVVTLKNSGNTAMTVADMAVSGDFAETGTCGASLAANTSCTISVTFKPTAGGTRTGSLTFSAGGSQTVSLSGEGQDFSFTGAATDSVSPGQSATFNLSVSPQGGLNDAIALSCSGAPSEATCTVSPSSVTVNGSNASSVQVTVSTTAASGLAPLLRTTPPSQSDRNKWLFLGLVVIAGMMLLARRRPVAMAGRLRLGLVTACMLVVLALGIVACGGGSSTTTSSNAGTPAGTYKLSVAGTATSGSVTVTHDVQVTLQVQ